MNINSNLRAFLLGIITIVLISLLLTMFAAWMIHVEILPISMLRGISCIISLVAAFTGGITCAKKAAAKRMPLCLGCGLVYLLMIFILRGVVFGNTGAQLWQIPIFTILGCLLGAVIGSGKKRRKY